MMHKNHLLTSLISNSSNSRSNSPANHMQLTTSLSFYPRTNSNSKYTPTKHQDIQNDHKFIPLIKSVLNLNVKIRQNYYFGFCKIQQITKAHKKMLFDSIEKDEKNQCFDQRNDGNKMQSSDDKGEIFSIDGMTEAFEKINIQMPLESKQNKMKKGITLLQDFILMKQSKQITLHNNKQEKKLTKAFQNIVNRHLKIKHGQFLINSIQNMIKSRKIYGVNLIQQYQKIKIRCQIMNCNLTSIINRGVYPFFVALRSYQPFRTTRIISSGQQEQQYRIKALNTSFLQASSGNLDKESRRQEEKVSQRSICQGKRPKLVLKEKKMTISKPLNLQFKAKKCEKTRYLQDKPLQVYEMNIQIGASYPMNVNIQYLTKNLPDLNDHCSLFRENQMQELIQVQKYDIQTCVTEWKQNMISQSNIVEQKCLTDRKSNLKNISTRSCRIQTQEKLENPSKNKHEIESSPLQKIDNILQKITQMKKLKNINSHKQIEKKKVNLIYKNQKDHYGSYNNSIENTPKYYKTHVRSTNDYKIEHFREFQKENFRERLITEKEKGMTPKNSCEFLPDSVVKHKSTMISKNPQQKVQKSQISTAKKMKLQIQNIINRRNKQLLSRNQSIAFK